MFNVFQTNVASKCVGVILATFFFYFFLEMVWMSSLLWLSNAFQTGVCIGHACWASMHTKCSTHAMWRSFLTNCQTTSFAFQRGTLYMPFMLAVDYSVWSQWQKIFNSNIPCLHCACMCERERKREMSIYCWSVLHLALLLFLECIPQYINVHIMLWSYSKHCCEVYQNTCEGYSFIILECMNVC